MCFNENIISFVVSTHRAHFISSPINKNLWIGEKKNPMIKKYLNNTSTTNQMSTELYCFLVFWKCFIVNFQKLLKWFFSSFQKYNDTLIVQQIFPFKWESFLEKKVKHYTIVSQHMSEKWCKCYNVALIEYILSCFYYLPIEFHIVYSCKN